MSMNFKKLTPELLEGLNAAGFNQSIKPIQSESMPHIKAGADIFLIAPEGSGKSTAIVMGVIQQLKAQFEEAPRAIIMTSTKEKAFELEEQFKLLGRFTDLRTFTVFDQGQIQYQKDIIYEGLDILIGTPKRIIELIKVNGVRLNKVKTFVVDDLDTFQFDKYGFVYQVVTCIDKSQLIMVANAWHNNFEKLSEQIMKNPRIIESN